MTGRDALIDYMRMNLIGPRNGDDETIDDPPSDIYTAGVLHPVSDDMNLLVDLEGGEDSGQGAQKELGEGHAPSRPRHADGAKMPG